MRETMPPVVRAVIAGCIVLFVVAIGLDPRAAVRDWSPLGVLSPSGLSLYRLGMTSGELWEIGWWWTILTATYLHGGLIHILFNLLWTREIGSIVERAWGPARFFLILSAGGAGGFMLSNAALGAPSIGASGAVFGFLAALIVLGRRRRAAAFTKQITQTALVLFGVSFLIPGVNNWGHAGGFLGGGMAAAALPLADARPESHTTRVVAGLVALATLAGFALSFVLTVGVR